MGVVVHAREPACVDGERSGRDRWGGKGGGGGGGGGLTESVRMVGKSFASCLSVEAFATNGIANTMLLCPPQMKTSPNRTSSILAV